MGVAAGSEAEATDAGPEPGSGEPDPASSEAAMNDGTDTRDRVIRLEARLEQLTRDVAEMDVKVTEIYALLQQARGARWILVALWVGAGALIGELLAIPSWPDIPG